MKYTYGKRRFQRGSTVGVDSGSGMGTTQVVEKPTGTIDQSRPGTAQAHRPYDDEVSTTVVASSKPISHRRFRGIDVPSSFTGMLAALSVELILATIIASVWGANYEFQGLTTDMALGVAAVAIGIMFVAYLIGGWAAARMARYDGGANGAMTAVWGLILAGIAAAVGAWAGDEYNVMSQIGLPDWFSADLTGAVIGGIALAFGAMLLGGFLGGLIGERYHRDVDSIVGCDDRIVG